jgi:hypothetical protein
MASVRSAAASTGDAEQDRDPLLDLHRVDTVYRPGGPVDVIATLRPLSRGSGDPAHRVVGSDVWLALRTPEGPASVLVRAVGDAVAISAWGAGAAWAVSHGPDLVGRGGELVASRLQSIPGVGPWTAAETAQRAHGDPDSPSVGDYHVPALVGWALTGGPVDDDGMLELLEPWRGHRERVVRLISGSGFRKPAFGPRMTIQDHRGH